MKDIQEQPFADYPEPWIREIVMKQLADNEKQLAQASFDFDKWFGLVSEEQVYNVGVNTNFALHPSYYWTHNEGRQFVNFIGKVENFEDHFNRFLVLMNINNVAVINSNVVELDSNDQNESFGYRYINRMSKKTIEKINRIFNRDFELFNYEQININAKVIKVNCMKFTGERYVSDLNAAQISYEHWHRYLYAMQFVVGKDVVDIACGEGYGSYLLAQTAKSVMGIDLSDEAITFAKKVYRKKNLSFLQGSVEKIPVAGTKKLDVIVSLETIEHVNEKSQKAFLKEIKRLLRDDGIFIVSTPNKLLYSDIPKYKNEFHLKEFYEQEFYDFLRNYFREVVLFGQKIFTGSNMWYLGRAQQEESFSEYHISNNGKKFEVNDDEKEALYLIAVCSDSRIKAAKNSFLLDKSLSILSERDEQIHALNQSIVERGRQVSDLSKTVDSLVIDRDSWKTGHEELQRAFKQLSHERDLQIADLAKTVDSLVIERDSWKTGHEELQRAFKQLSHERDLQVLKLNQAVAALKGQIGDFKQALAGRDLLIEDLKQAVNDRDSQIILLNAEKNRITSSHSWKITMPLRFVGRLLRGDWLTVRASIVSLRNDKRNPFMEEETSANKHVVLKDAADNPKNKQNVLSEQMPFRGKRILLVSYYCPSRAHAGGLRILDIYSLIKSTFPNVQIDLFTHKRPAIDWSYEDVENIFDNIFLSPVEALSFSGFNQLNKASSSYDVIDLQFHQTAYNLESWRKVGQKIIFTPLESLLRCLLIDLGTRDIFSMQKMLRNIMLAKEELSFARRADEVVCVSEKDASSLRMFCRARKIRALETAISNIEFTDAFEHRYEDINPGRKQPIVLYIAYFGSETNINALKWYLVNVHPLISKTLPDYKLQVVGRGDLSVFKDYRSPSIEFVGEVPRLTPYIQNAKVGIAPALNGGGFRGKINQYAIYGVPVVASKIAAKGLVYQDKIDIFITDQDRVFAERCIRLLRDNDLNRAMGQKARNKAFAQYTWESKMDTIKKIYNLEAAET